MPATPSSSSSPSPCCGIQSPPCASIPIPLSAPQSTPPSPIHIRSYRPEDHAAVAEVFTDGMMLYANALDGDNRAGFIQYIDRSLGADLSTIEQTYVAPGGHFWVAVAELEAGREEIVGCVALENRQGGEGELRRMSVRADYRHAGIGRLLVAHLEDWAKAHGMSKITLSTAEVMQPAVKFYQSLGYARGGCRAVGNDFCLLQYCKALGPADGPATKGSAPIRVRTYRAADHDIVVQLFTDGMMLYANEVDAQEREGFMQYIQESEESDLAAIEHTYIDLGGHFWVAVTDLADGKEQVVGCVGLEKKDDEEGELRRMSVHGDYRKQGIGRILVTHLEEYAKAHGMHRIMLWTSELKPFAFKFYETLAYKHVDSRDESPSLRIRQYIKDLTP